MIKLLFCMTKAESVSSQEFRRYWKEQHAPLGRFLARETGAVYFNQNTTLELEINSQLNQLLGSNKRPYDGVGEVLWEDTKTIQGILKNPVFQHRIEEIKLSLAEFTNPKQSVIFFTEMEEIPLDE